MTKILTPAGEAVRRACRVYSLSQEHIAALLDVDQSTISHRMTGRTSWRLDELEALAAHLNVPVSALIEDAA